jgi:hypothetical protein
MPSAAVAVSTEMVITPRPPQGWLPRDLVVHFASCFTGDRTLGATRRFAARKPGS